MVPVYTLAGLKNSRAVMVGSLLAAALDSFPVVEGDTRPGAMWDNTAVDSLLVVVANSLQEALLERSLARETWILPEVGDSWPEVERGLRAETGDNLPVAQASSVPTGAESDSEEKERSLVEG